MSEARYCKKYQRPDRRKSSKEEMHMNHGLSDQVRERARIQYVQPEIAAGKQRFSVSVKELLKDMEANGFPANHARQVCSALCGGKFLRDNGLEIEAVDGPPSKTSTTVVVHYRIAAGQAQAVGAVEPLSGTAGETPQETPEEWAHRLTGKIFGILKEELAEYGGGEAFIRWIRSEDEEEPVATANRNAA
jgi:hypothetical protein